MTHNLLLPFMLREAGIHINEVPKFHVTSPTEEHHAITFQETNFQIPLTLHGTLDRSQNISLHFICITLHLHYITFAFKNRATSARNA